MKQRLLYMDDDTVLLATDGEPGRTVPLPDALDACSTEEPIEVFVFTSDVFSVRAVPATVDARAREKVKSGTIYSTECIRKSFYQVLAVPSHLVSTIREARPQARVVPYAVTLRGSLDRHGLSELPQPPPDQHGGQRTNVRVALDCVAEQVLVTVWAGKEILTTRRMPVDNPQVEVETARLLRAARAASGRLVAGRSDDPTVKKIAGAVGWPLDEVERDSLFDLLDFGSAKHCELHLPAEVAAQRKRADLRKRVTWFSAASAVCAVMLVLLLASWGRTLAIEQDIDRARTEIKATEFRMGELYADKYAALVAHDNQDAAKLWVELLFGVPTELVVISVTTHGRTREAVLEQRADIMTAPMSGTEVRGILDSIDGWRDATVAEEFTAHTVRFKLSRTL